ncbi:MAG: alpha/beta hydrolase [Candidatus Flexifilum sp.]|jgi:pimeloyl-ACP methyl ester carboxylesterase
MADPIEIVHRPGPSTTPILFVHGAFHGAWCWQEHWMPYFSARGWDCWALSLRAHGATPGDIRRARIADYVADVAAVVRDLPASPILIGHSMGGFTIQKYLEEARHPARAAVLLASVPHRGAAGYMIGQTLRHPIRVAAQLVARRVNLVVDTPETLRRNFFSSAMPAADVARLHPHLVDESALAILDFSFFALPNVRAVRARRVPMLVVAALEDTVFSVAEQALTAAAYGAELRTVPGGHDVMLDVAWQAAADAVLEWMALHLPGASG